MRRNGRLRLQTKIVLLIIAVVVFSIINTTLYITGWRLTEIRKETENNIMNIARIVANAPVVKDNLVGEDTQRAIQGYIKEIIRSTDNIEVIVVVDMRDIRYAHPIEERIGGKFVGGDEKRVLEKGESYISDAEGTLGKQIRAFVPVFSGGRQVGFVMVGETIENYSKVRRRAYERAFLSSVIGLTVGIIGALMLGKNIRKTLLGLEPDEIRSLYIQKESMLKAMQEGVIAIDRDYNITLVNDSAMKILKLDNIDSVKDYIDKIFPTSKMEEIFESGESEYFKEQVIRDTVIFLNRVLIKSGNRVIGAIATFNDKTLVNKLAQELTGVNQIVEGLRANNHEFMNKLHVILGLIELEELEEAKKYIITETERQQDIIKNVVDRIKDPSVAGLIIGKISRSKELGINMKVDSESNLYKRSGLIHSSMIITILGNLIENSMDSLIKSSGDEKNINVLIVEDDELIKIQVEDNGIGIKDEDIPNIFKQGFTTKDGNRGRGLFLLKELVDTFDGDIEVESRVEEYTRIAITIPK